MRVRVSSRRGVVLLLAAVVACVACTPVAGTLAGATVASRPAPTPARLFALDYHFTVDAALSTLTARVCMRGAAPTAFVYGAPTCAAFMRAPRVLGAGPVRPLRVVAGQIILDGVAPDSCIAYDVDLTSALEHDALLLAYPGQGSLVLGAELLLWRPAERPEGFAARVSFDLPPNIDVSVPWPATGDGAFALSERAFAFTSHIVLGHFTRRRVVLPNTQLELVVLDGFPPDTVGLLAPWLEHAARVVMGVTGAFPEPFAQVIVVPTAASPMPIHFGYTGRGGAPSVVLFLPTDANADGLRTDWIAIHELSHLLLPFVSRQGAWLSEGVATYYQEVLRARSGAITSEDAWRNLYEGAQLGRTAQGSLQDETRRMPTDNNYKRVYWAGAAIALLGDVALREQSRGAASLDSVLAGLASCRRDADRPYSVQQMLAEMDRAAGAAVFAPIASRYLNGAGLPDLTELYAKLGLGPDGHSLKSQQPAALAWARDAIMLHLAEP